MANLDNLRGAVIMFDGPDNVGKSTQLDLLEKDLINAKLDVVRSRVSGGTPIGEMLREASFSSNDRPPETDLYIALAQYYALAAEIKKWRQAGKTVIVDRSPLSMLSYQVYGSGLNRKTGIKATGQSIKLFSPDAIVVYTASLKTLQNRAKRARGSDYFGTKPAEYFERVIKGYQDGAKRYQKLVKKVNAEASVDEVHSRTLKVLESLK